MVVKWQCGKVQGLWICKVLYCELNSSSWPFFSSPGWTVCYRTGLDCRAVYRQRRAARKPEPQQRRGSSSHDGWTLILLSDLLNVVKYSTWDIQLSAKWIRNKCKVCQFYCRTSLYSVMYFIFTIKHVKFCSCTYNVYHNGVENNTFKKWQDPRS